MAVIGCVGSSTTPTAATPTTDGAHLLVEVKGQVTLKRAAWTKDQATSFGTMLRRGDQIKVESGGQAKVLCDNLLLASVPEGAPTGLNNLCPQSAESVLKESNSAFINTR